MLGPESELRRGELRQVRRRRLPQEIRVKFEGGRKNGNLPELCTKSGPHRFRQKCGHVRAPRVLAAQATPRRAACPKIRLFLLSPKPTCTQRVGAEHQYSTASRLPEKWLYDAGNPKNHRIRAYKQEQNSTSVHPMLGARLCPAESSATTHYERTTTASNNK